MSELPGDEKVISILRQQGLLTDDQVRRLKLSLASGKDLTWALGHVPLVEPLGFLRAQSMAASAAPPLEKPATTAPTFAPGDYELKPLPPGTDSTQPPPGFALEITDADGETTDPDDSDGEVPTLEIEDRDYAAGFEGVGRPVSDVIAEPTSSSPASTPSASPVPTPIFPLPPRPPASRSAAASPPTADAGPVPSPEGYLRPGIVPPAYDLADDEGIPLVNRVNALFIEAINSGTKRIGLRPTRDGGMELLSVSDYGTEGNAHPIDVDEGEKIANRLKIMARIEHWRKPPLKGLFHLHHHRRQVRVLVDVLESPVAAGREEVVLHLLATA